MPAPTVLSSDERSELLRLYQDRTCTVAELLKKFKITGTTLMKLVKDAGIPLRGRSHGKSFGERLESRKYQVRHDAFVGAENSSVASYFVGIMLTDGCLRRTSPNNPVNQGSYTVHLAQSESRKDVVYKLQDFLGTDSPVKVESRRFREDLYYLIVSSRQLFETLSTYGVVPKKTGKQVVAPCMRENRDFWRGVFDGDGHVEVAKSGRLSLKLGNTSPDLVNRLYDYWESVTGPGWVTLGQYRISSGKIQHRVCVSGPQAMEVAAAMYEGAEVYSESKFRPYATARDAIRNAT